MNKSELVKAMSVGSGLSQADSERALNAFTDTVTEGLASGDTITLVGFGSFSTVDKPSREGRNPQTGEALTIAARTAPKFKAGSSLKSAVNK